MQLADYDVQIHEESERFVMRFASEFDAFELSVISFYYKIWGAVSGPFLASKNSKFSYQCANKIVFVSNFITYLRFMTF